MVSIAVPEQRPVRLFTDDSWLHESASPVTNLQMLKIHNAIVDLQQEVERQGLEISRLKNGYAEHDDQIVACVNTLDVMTATPPIPFGRGARPQGPGAIGHASPSAEDAAPTPVELDMEQVFQMISEGAYRACKSGMNEQQLDRFVTLAIATGEARYQNEQPN